MERQNLSNSIKRLFGVLALEKKEITALYIIAILSGLIQLTLPLGIQAIINFAIVATGRNYLPSSMWVLILLVVVGVFFTGLLKIHQMKIVEKIQQKIFTRFTFEFSSRIPKLNIKEIDTLNLPELVNRFFDIPTLQKSIAKLLLDIPIAIIQLFFGLILLSFYNSVFILFGILLLTILYLILHFSSPKGFEASIQESNYKYKIAGWIQEIARGIKTFKFSNSDLHNTKTDKLLSGYLISRTKHFRILKIQYWALIIFKILITAAMLIVGAILLIQQQINIGQFIAAEIVILTIINAVEKLILSLENIYDLLTSVEKIHKITEKPLEHIGSLDYKKSNGIQLEATNLSFGFNNKLILQDLSFTLKAGGKMAIIGDGDSGKTILLRILTGVFQEFEGSLCFNQIPLSNYNLASLRSHLGIYLQKQDIFLGSLWENLSVGNENIEEKEVIGIFKMIGLNDYFKNLPNGFDTNLEPSGKRLSSSIVQKILITRALLNSPQLLLLDEPLTALSPSERNNLTEYLFGLNNTTIIIATKNNDLAEKCDVVISLENGRMQK